MLEGDFPVITTNTYKEKDEHTIYLGVDLTEKLEKADDATLDDNILIDVENFNGVITGTNPRSVLIGVYRFLREKGYVFMHPGKKGEHYPEDVNGERVLVSEKASYRYRNICIEGSVYQENLMDTIDWIPKVAMNGYLVQFTVPQVFFDRYYSDDNKDIAFLGEHREAHSVSSEEVTAMIELLEKEIEKRDLQYHSIGHGWTNEAFNIEATSWESVDVELTEEQRSIMAQVNGERGLWNGTPMSTQVCLSNPKARDLVTDGVVEFLKIHKNVTHLHFWLADGSRGYCECEECQKLRVSDWYVMMVNELDEKLTAANIDTKIVFEAGYGTLWKPLEARVKNSDRFVLMVAPITRRFSVPLERDESVQMAEYKLNQSEYPKSGPENIAYLYDWQKDYDGDCLDFDYHFTWDHYFDFSQYQLTQIIYQDMKNLRGLGLDGLISCQSSRTFLPTSLGMQVMARVLWNREEKYEDLERDILSAEFGENYQKVINYLSELSKYNGKEVIRCEAIISDDGVMEKLEKASDILDDFEAEIKANIENASCDLYKRSWEKLHFHNRLYRKMIEYYRNYNNPDKELLEKDVYDFAKKYELRFKDIFDAYYFCWSFELLIKPRLSMVEVIK